MAYTTYIASDNTTTNGIQLGANDDRDVLVKKIIVGLPATSKSVTVYNSNVAVNGATTNIATKLSTPATLATGQLPIVYDFTTGGAGPAESAGFDSGLPLTGRGVVITDASQVTVIWDYATN